MNSQIPAAPAARFTKEELFSELRGLIYLQARSLSWVYDPAAAYRLLEWPPSTSLLSEHLLNPSHTDFDNMAKDMELPEDFGRFPIFRVFDQLYDYGVLGIHRRDMEWFEPGTMATFLAAWLSDISQSSLVWEVHAGLFPCEMKCAAMTISLAEARGVLDGQQRFRPDTENVAHGALTFAEVALLAGIDERSVRNAASKKDGGLVATPAEDDRKSYIQADVARAWLKTRKGFIPTRESGLYEFFDPLSRSFDSQSEALGWLRHRCEQSDVSLERYLALLGRTGPDVALEWMRAPLPVSPEEIRAVASALDINPEALALRLEEVALLERSRLIEKRLTEIRRSRKTP